MLSIFSRHTNQNIAGWSSLVARRAHKTHFRFTSLLDIISVIGIYRILNF